MGRHLFVGGRSALWPAFKSRFHAAASLVASLGLVTRSLTFLVLAINQIIRLVPNLLLVSQPCSAKQPEDAERCSSLAEANAR